MTSDNKGFLPDKYAKGYKGAQDWLSETITGEVTTMDKKSGKRSSTDVSALFALAQFNNIDVAKHKARRSAAGFAGRFRMTLRNMLQATTKRRHGLFGAGGKWITAPAEWLKSKDAPDNPTEKRTGEKIAAPKAGKAGKSKKPPKADKADKADKAASK